MLCTVEYAKSRVSTDKSDDVIKDMLDSIECTIRRCTHNDFIDLRFTYSSASVDGKLDSHSLFTVGDTIEILHSLNDGVYVITEHDSENNTFTLDKVLYTQNSNVIYKVVYPKDIVTCALEMLKYDIKDDKREVKSETLSRKSVTYATTDTFICGYPERMLSKVIRKYGKARF